MVSKTLKRQLKRLELTLDQPPQSLEEWAEFLELVDDSYRQYEEGRYLLERSLEISSKEMSEKIEQNKEMGLQLAQASKLSSIGTLASGIAHELNNPLTGIIGHIESLKKGKLDPEKIPIRYERISKLCNRMVSIVGHLRKLSRNSQEDDFTTISLLTPIEDACELIGSQLKFENIIFSIKSDFDQPPIILGDSNKLESIFQNLLTNSLHAFLDHPDISDKLITLKIQKLPSSNTVQIVYTDTAGGMDKEVIDKIFDPFFTTKAVGKGTGLGMSVTNQVISEHKGQIKCESNSGIGTTFTIELPLKGEQKKIVHSISQFEAPKNFKIQNFEKRIMFVDDEIDICEIFDDILSTSYSVESFTNSLKAKDRLSLQSFDMLLTDIKMPLIDGIKLAEFARTINSKIELVFISGHADSDVKSELKKFKNYHFFDKPMSSAEEFKYEIDAIINKKAKSA